MSSLSPNSFSFTNDNNNELFNLKQTFMNFKEEEANAINPLEYTISIDGARANMVNWLSFLCTKLNFTDQTLFRSVSIFDQYISKISVSEVMQMNQDNLNLIAIACLSLSTKLEEINCNYISFLNDKVLNSPNSQIFTNKDLTKMELRILKTLKYKTIYSTPFDFIDIYIELFKNLFGANNSMINMNIQLISQIKTLAINLMKNNINNIMYITNTSSHFAYLCFIQALNQLNAINRFQFKQLEKSIFTFKYQIANIF